MTTYTRRENARRAAVAAGIPKNRVVITVHKNGDEVRFGWTESATLAKPKTITTASKVPKVEQEQNGVKRPKAGGLCAAVWAWLDAHPSTTLHEAKAEAVQRGWNPNNVSCEFYARRKFLGISSQIEKK